MQLNFLRYVHGGRGGGGDKKCSLELLTLFFLFLTPFYFPAKELFHRIWRVGFLMLD